MWKADQSLGHVVCRHSIRRGSWSGSFLPVGDLGDDGSFLGLSGGELVFAVIIGIFFLLVIALIVASIIRGGLQWRKDHTGPTSTETAYLRAKRAKAVGGGNDTAVRSQYFVTVESLSGERRELRVDERIYGLLIEGDRGECVTQGGRLVSFKRQL